MANFYASYPPLDLGTAVLSIGTIDAQAKSADGAVIASNQLFMQTADASDPGLVSTGAQTIAGAKKFNAQIEAAAGVKLDGATSGNIQVLAADSTTSYSIKMPAAQSSGTGYLQNDGTGALSWAGGTGGSGVNAIGTFDSKTANADGGTINSTTIYFQSADATNPGMVNVSSQTFAGTKTFANIIDSGLTASTVPYANASKQLTSSAVTPTELGYVSGVTSAIQTQLNSKQATLTIGNLTDAGTDGITVTGGTSAVIGTGTSIAQHVADATHNGYLSSTDWSTFNGKQASGNYITDLTGDVTASGPGSAAATLATVNTNTGSFGSSTAIPNFTVNGKGLITAAGTNAVVAPAGTLTGTTLASNVVTSSLTTVGTIGTGVWNGTAVDATHGGTAQTTWTKGDLLYASAANTLSKLAIGTTNQALIVTSGAPAWGTLTAAPSYNYTSQTTTYSAVINDWVFCSGASFAVTLPTAVGKSGQAIVVQHAGTSLTQVYTLNTTSAQTIGGIASGSYALYTNGEVLIAVSDGSNWQIVGRKTTTPATTFTMTITGTTTNPTKSTNHVDAATWTRNGQFMTVNYLYTAGGSSGAVSGSGTYLYATPTSASIDTTVVTGNTTLTQTFASSYVGSGGINLVAGSACDIIGVQVYDSTHVVLNLIDALDIFQGSAHQAFGGNINFSFVYTVPITGWQP